MNEGLSQFIEHARKKGIDHATIFLMLRSSGWKDKEIADAVASLELATPVPERVGIGSPRDAFLHLLAFTALFTSAISLIFLVFTYIEVAFPDPAQRVSSYQVQWMKDSIRWSQATLIVAYPLFLIVWWLLLREIGKAPERASSLVRRWLGWLTLFVIAVTILADVTTLVFYLVEGYLTVRFLLKVAALFVITAGIFVYLISTLRSEGEAAK